MEHSGLEAQHVTTVTDTSHTDAPTATSGRAFFRTLSIGSKLSSGFGLLVGLTLLVVSLTYIASEAATATINQTSAVRVPAALVSSRAHADLLQMFSDVRGYLALSDDRYKASYRRNERAFQTHLEELKRLSTDFDPQNRSRLAQLEDAYRQWQPLPDQLFMLHDDRMAREPAYRWLNTIGIGHAGSVLINVDQMIAMQAGREPSRQNTALIDTMSSFRSSFAAMFTGLRGYVNTGNPNFRFYEYELNIEKNEEVWDFITSQSQLLTAEQRSLLETIRSERTQLIEQVPIEIFAVVESAERRKDLAQFESQVEPLTIEMQQMLVEITKSQQSALQTDLAQGSAGLNQSRNQALAGGIAAAVLGIAMAIFLRQIIAGPVQRLTSVARQIQNGDLAVQAQIETGDEIGTFARTFNNMTGQLRRTMQQIRSEKKRADDLLDVVIPIGVALSSERDFNRLLENMLVEAMAFCNADGGAIFLRDEQVLQLMMLRVTSREAFFGGTSGQPIAFAPLALHDETGSAPDQRYPATYATGSGATVNIADADAPGSPFNAAQVGELTAALDYRPISVLALPLKTSGGEVLGVLQLINARHPETSRIIPFDLNLQQMMESFSSLAVAALESYIREQGLRQEIRQLRIQIDESKQQQQVNEIVESDFFQDLQARARDMRRRNQRESH